jgi:hypothetical protein
MVQTGLEVGIWVCGECSRYNLHQQSYDSVKLSIQEAIHAQTAAHAPALIKREQFGN